MIRVLVPDMPTAEELLPFLRQIDQARIYSNGGPLMRQLEASLAGLIGGQELAVVSNGTLALELALRALQLPPGAQVLVPAVTYVATGQAVVNAGLQPVLCDVDPLLWQLDPATALNAVARHGVAAVVPVATFGVPVPVEPWDAFARETRIPVVLDAAGAILDQPRATLATTVYSLHATKILGAGEGGVVAVNSSVMRNRIASLASFGEGGTNAKLSEYHAAVALASIEGLASKAGRVRACASAYQTRLEKLPFTLQRQPTASTTLLVGLLPRGKSAADAQQALAAAGVDTKQWYRPYLDELPQFAGCKRPLWMGVTEDLRQRSIGLPFHSHMTAEDVGIVCDALAAYLEQA